jgi:hypothetical protein
MKPLVDNVGQLIEKLKEFPASAEVQLSWEDAGNCCGQEMCYCMSHEKRESINAVLLEELDENAMPYPKGKKVVIIRAN